MNWKICSRNWNFQQLKSPKAIETTIFLVYYSFFQVDERLIGSYWMVYWYSCEQEVKADYFRKLVEIDIIELKTSEWRTKMLVNPIFESDHWNCEHWTSELLAVHIEVIDLIVIRIWFVILFTHLSCFFSSGAASNEYTKINETSNTRVKFKVIPATFVNEIISNSFYNGRKVNFSLYCDVWAWTVI